MVVDHDFRGGQVLTTGGLGFMGPNLTRRLVKLEATRWSMRPFIVSLLALAGLVTGCAMVRNTPPRSSAGSAGRRAITSR